MHTRILQASILVTGLALAPGQAMAQQSRDGTGQQPAGPGVAQNCMNDLSAFGQEMRDDGFWLSGYRTAYGWGTYRPIGEQTAAMPPGTAPNMGAGPPGLTTGPAAGGGAPAPAAQAERGTAASDRPGAAASPFARVDWQSAPTEALRTLYAAAHILAQNGSEQPCQAVLAEARDLYGAYVHTLRQAGVEPGEIRSYREQQLALARPVSERARGMRADAITGTDVRNLQDAHLGSVRDVVFDPRSGDIAYVIMGRGGFLGIGRDHVAVPWQQLRVTPNLDTFVLDVQEAQLERAPQVDPDTFATDEGYARRRGEIDRFWQEARAG